MLSHLCKSVQHLREYLPLKQGLRHDSLQMKHSHHHAPRVSSIKTRIKTNKETKITLLSPLREYLPLKQGLRQ